MQFAPKQGKRDGSVVAQPRGSAGLDSAEEEKKAPININKVNDKAAAQEVNDREWVDFGVMAIDIREATDANLDIEYGGFFNNKRFYTFKLLGAQINKYKDMPYLLSLLERGDHLYDNYDISDFAVYDNEKKDCTDEQLALVIKK